MKISAYCSILLLIALSFFLAFTGQGLNYSSGTDLGSTDASIWNDNNDERVGWALDMVGDVNRDGYGDFIISAPLNGSYTPNGGRVWLFFGSETGWSPDMGTTGAVASFKSKENDGRAGQRVAGVGDVNHDGYDDFVLGHGLSSQYGTNRGGAFMFFGKPAGWEHDLNFTDADVIFMGESDGDHAGSGMDGVGDVNGDGIEDMVIGSGGANGCGEVYVIFGMTSNWPAFYNLGSANASYKGRWASGYGNRIRGVGDVNGDNLDDFVVAAMNYNNEQGEVYLYLGKETGWTMHNEISAVDASWYGEATETDSGYSLDGAGDVDGDGYDDFLIGAPRFTVAVSNEGKVYLVYGRETGWPATISMGDINCSFIGQNPGDGLGYGVAGLGDIDGNFLDDIALGAYHNDDSFAEAGKTYVILGAGAKFGTNQSATFGAMSFEGEEAGDESGSSIYGMNDVNGDGLDDMLIAAPHYRGGANGRGKVYLVFPDSNDHPITSYVDVIPTPTAGSNISSAKLYSTVYVRLTGTDMNAVFPDVALVNVTCSRSPQDHFRMELVETTSSSGVFIAPLTLEDRTHEGYGWLGGEGGDTVHIVSVTDPAKDYYLTIDFAPPKLTKLLSDNTANEDQEYNLSYKLRGGMPPLVWDLNAPAWLSFDETNLSIGGTPQNDHVGLFTVNLSVTDDVGEKSAQEFDITVKNNPPLITTPTDPSALEGEEYSVDYNSTDDGQGTITWHMTTNAGAWLQMDPDTGILNGTPPDDKVGNWMVNVSVDDGNNGWAYQNFTLSVQNVNDAPVVTGVVKTEANEDELYFCDLGVEDIDDTIFVWSLSTNASWLSIDGAEGNISGIPLNDDVGIYFVNATVHDTSDALDYKNYTLTVLNVNDAPVWEDVPANGELQLMTNYSFDVNATDVDAGTILEYSIASVPDSEIEIDEADGIITWQPKAAGTYTITITVTDGTASITHDFQLEAIRGKVNVPPRFTSWPDQNATVDKEWKYIPTATDDNYDAVTLTLTTSPPGMIFSTGTVSWTPEVGQEGNHTVIVQASDGTHSKEQEFIITVHPQGSTPGANHAPEFDSVSAQNVKAGSTFTLQLSADDDDGDTLVFSKVSGPEGLEISSTGLVIWTPGDGDTGTKMVEAEVSDGTESVRMTFIIEVEEADDRNGDGPGIIIIVIAVVVLLLLIIIIIVIVLVIMRSRKKHDEPEVVTPAVGTAPRTGKAEPIIPEVEGPDIFKQKENQKVVQEAMAKSQDDGQVQEAVPDMDLPPELGVEDPTLLHEEPQDSLEENPMEILGGAITGDQEDIPGGIKPAMLALPPAKILNIEEDPMKNADIAEILIITNEGMLLNHYAKDPASQLDHDILSGMLTAVQGFVKDSFTNVDSTLSRLEMREFTVLIEPGKYVTAVGITRDRQNRELSDQLLRMMRDIEKEMSDAFKDWDGDMSGIQEIDIFIQRLLEGGYEE